MNTNFTTKMMEALQGAVQGAAAGGRAQVYPAELLLALLKQEGGLLPAVL